MKKTRFTDEPIIQILNEAAAGRPIRELARHHGVSETTVHRWRQKYGGLLEFAAAFTQLGVTADPSTSNPIGPALG